MPAVLPYRSRGAAVTSAELAMRAAAGQRFWEASAREVAGAVGNVGVQNCGECGLSLSANARFCRRCGTRQAQPALAAQVPESPEPFVPSELEAFGFASVFAAASPPDGLGSDDVVPPLRESVR